jgi:chromosome segregation ATPase
MATRVYRPDAGRSWREASATSSNAEVSQILARYSTDLNNRKLKRGMTRAQNAMTLAGQGVEAWGKAYERVAAIAKGQVAGLATQQTSANSKAAEINQLTARMNKLTSDYNALAKSQGYITPAYKANYLAEWNPLNERYQTIKPVWKAQTSQNEAAQKVADENSRRLQGLEAKYNRADKRSQRAVRSYKHSVRAYNEGFYPV